MKERILVQQSLELEAVPFAVPDRVHELIDDSDFGEREW
jgi:hypothetical protein